MKLTPSYIDCVGSSATRYYSKMQTLRTLFEKHKSLMCMRSKAALYVQNHVDTFTFTAGMYTPVAVEEQSKLICRSNVLMNSCQLLASYGFE